MRRLNQLDGAVEAYMHALAIEPTRADAHLNLGIALQSAARFDAAALSLERAINLGHPKSDMIRDALRQLQAKHGSTSSTN